MKFAVPQFIEHKAKILGPLTFRQIIFIGIPASICFFLYFSLAKTNFLLFLLVSAILLGGGIAFAFLKINGRELPIILTNFLQFILNSRVYIWKRKKTAVIGVRKKEAKKETKKETKEEEPLLKVVERSKLKKLNSQIETKTK